MIKRVVEQIFQDSAADSLRKTLGEIERAASSNGWQQGRELLCDFITRVTTLNYANDQNGAALEYYKGIVAKHREVSEENGRVDEEPVEDYMVRVWHSLGVAQRFAEDIQAKLKTKDATIKSLQDDRALMDEWHGVSLENGRLPDELMTDYMVRVWDSLQVAHRLAEDMKAKLQSEEGRYSRLLSETTEKLLGSAARIDSLEKQLGEVRKCARKHGWNEVYGWTNEASLCDFLKTALDVSQPGIEALRAQVEDLKAGEAEAKAAAEEYGVLPDETHAQFIKRVLGDLATAKEEARRERERANRINAESEENMKKLWKCANDLGRADYEPLWSFMDRQAAEIGKLNSTHADDIARIDGLSARLAAIAAEASECGAEEGESVIDFLKRQDAEIEKEGTRAFEAGEALKMWKQDAQDKGQELLKVRAWHEEKLQKIRELEANYARLQSEIRTELSKIAQVVNPEGKNGLVIDFVREVTADRDRIRAELAAILAEANKSGRCSGDPVALIRQGQTDLDARISAEREAEDIKKRWRELNKHAALKGMAGNETTAEFITRQYRLAVERQEGLDRASETIRRLTSDLENAIVDKVLAGNGAKEVARLSDLVASLQVELDEAKGQYSGIMAQLGNETPLQMIERMQRLSKDQLASTIPHDERTELVGEIADLRKRLEAKTAEHAKLDYYVNCVRICASNHGLRKGEELKSFINNKCNDLAEAMKTVESQSAAIAEAKQATDKYAQVVQTAAKLRDWAFTIRHKVLVKLVHDKAMTEYDDIMKELDGKAGTDAKVPQ